MSDSTTAMVECPLCGEDFDPEAAGGWCTNSACGEWRYDGDASAEDDADDASSDAPETQDPWETLGDADDESGTESTGSADPLAESESDDKQTPLEPSDDDEKTADEPAAGDVEESADDDETADGPELDLADVDESDADDESGDGVEAEAATAAESSAEEDLAATEGAATAETCPSCDADVDADAEFCPSCGTDLTADEEADDAELTECPACGGDVGPEDSFCASCGEDLDAHRGDQQTACPSCGADVDPDDRFCASCGQDLEGTDEGARQNEAQTPATNGTSAEGVPSSLALTAYGHSVVVGDGDTVGREIRSLLTEAGRPENEAVRIHREHVRFVRENGQFYLVDLGENPTTLNGRSLTKGDREAVEPGDELGLSGTVTLDVERP